MIKYLIPFLLISSCAHLPKQIDQGFLFKKISDLPPSINESSGLIVMDGKLITHNDSGNMAMLYELDTTGTITNYIKYNYLTNRDWEAIAQSDKAIHIADIGNNQGDRKDLKYTILIKEEFGRKKLTLTSLVYHIQHKPILKNVVKDILTMQRQSLLLMKLCIFFLKTGLITLQRFTTYNFTATLYLKALKSLTQKV